VSRGSHKGSGNYRGFVTRLGIAAVAALIGCLVALASPASAAFPGLNGKIAFTSDPSGSDLEVYSMNFDGSGPSDLTNDPNSDASPSWSPDGTRIVFSTDRDVNDEIYVMAADGSGLTDLTNNAASDTVPAWSGDSTKIAFTRDDGSFNLEIWTMNSDGTGQTKITNNPALDTAAAWSPDSQKIAFVSTRDGNSEIYTMNPNGSGLANLSQNAATDSGPDWSPDGSKIAFSSRRDGNAEIYVTQRRSPTAQPGTRRSARHAPLTPPPTR
jgi:Tol biopolymer transport system component